MKQSDQWFLIVIGPICLFGLPISGFLLWEELKRPMPSGSISALILGVFAFATPLCIWIHFKLKDALSSQKEDGITPSNLILLAIIVGLPFAVWIGIREANSPAYSGDSKSQADARLDRIREGAKKAEALRSQSGQQQGDVIAREIVQGQADQVYSTLRSFRIPAERLRISHIEHAGFTPDQNNGQMSIRFYWEMPMTPGNQRLVAMSANQGVISRDDRDFIQSLVRGERRQILVTYRKDGFGNYQYWIAN